MIGSWRNGHLFGTVFSGSSKLGSIYFRDIDESKTVLGKYYTCKALSSQTSRAFAEGRLTAPPQTFWSSVLPVDLFRITRADWSQGRRCQALGSWGSGKPGRAG
jgi:hypothetical protein